MIKITSTDTNIYIESQNIKVFPCAYRGHYDSTNPKVFDPEARATTEANFTNTFHKLSDNKKSYTVAWVPDTDPTYPDAGTLKCVIGGYYFEIYNHTIDQFFYTTDGEPTPYYLCIKTDQITLGTSESDAGRTTTVLGSFADTTNYLDVKQTQGNDYAFTGLLVSKTADGGGNATASLAPFMAVPNGVEGAEDYTYKIDPATLPITNLLDVGSGSYSIQMIAGDTDTTEASGDYSVALGLGTTASGEASTALGNNTEASAKGAFAAGNNTKASGEGAFAVGNNTEASGPNTVALGNNTKAVSDGAVALGTGIVAGKVVITEKEGENPVTERLAKNQVVIGQYNTEDTEQAFIIANGTPTLKSNKFTVSYAGDVKALGTLETKGSIKATGDSNNDLELGTLAEGSSGSIKVYGISTTPVFSVENSGNTTIAGDTNISGVTTITNDTESTSTITGALKISGGAGVAKNLNVGGTANIAGNTQITNTTAASGTTAALTVKGGEIIEKNLIIKGTDTSTSTTTGALVVTGGVGLGGNLCIGGTTTITGETILNNTVTVATDKDTTLGGALTVAKAATLQATLEVTGTATLKNATTITNNTESTSITTGALVVNGGVGIGKKFYVGGATTLNNNLTVADSKTTTLGGETTIKGNTQITSTTNYSKAINGTCSAALVVNGGAYIAKKLHVAGDTTFYDNLEIGAEQVIVKKATQSTATNDGALIVVGGVGIGGNLNINGDTKIAKNLTLVGTSGTANTLQLGNESTSNKGGELLIYGSGTTKVFSVDNTGNTDLKGNLTVTGTISGGNKLSLGSGATAVEISSAGITGLSGLTVNGQINATVFNAASDARLKCNIEDYEFEKSVLDLPIKRFEYINDEAHTKYVGCLAQDLQRICPELVIENSDGMLSIHESKLVYALLQEVKALKGRVEQLERR